MTKHDVPRRAPSLINHNRFSNNGMVPRPSFWQRIARGMNHAANWQSRCWMMLSNDLQGSVTGQNGNVIAANFAGVTGAATHTMTALIGVRSPSSSSSDPTAELKYKASGDSSQTSAGVIHFHGGVGSFALSQVHYGVIQWSVTPNTHYTGNIVLDDYAAIVYCTIIETPDFGGIDDTDTGAVDPTEVVGLGDILDSGIEGMVKASNALLRQNGPHLISYSNTDPGNLPKTSSSSYSAIETDYKNRIDLSSHGRVNRDVHVVFAVNAFSTSGATNGVRLRNTTDGATLAEIEGFDTDSNKWLKTSAVLVPADVSGDDLVIQFRSDGTNNLELRAASLYQYEYDWSPALAYSAHLQSADSAYFSITDADQNGLDVRRDLTLECWVKFESLPSNGNKMRLLSKWAASGDNRSYALWLANAAGTYELLLGVTDDGLNEHSAKCTWSGAATGTWVHFAASFDASAYSTGPSDQVSMYIDGASQTVSDHIDDAATSIYDGDADFEVGAMDGAEHLDGKICDVRVWRGVRSSSEIADNYNRDVQLAAHLVGHWFKNDSTIGSMGTDQSEYGNDLTANGGVAVSSDTPY